MPLLTARCIVCLIASACGGGQAASGGPQSKDPTAGMVSEIGDSSLPPSSSAGPATTTLILGDGGDLQGVKLAEVHSVSSAHASGAPPKESHGHDPGRGPSDIRAIILAHRDAARACYEKGLGEHPRMEGNLVIQWTIGPKGNVTQVSLDTSRSQITELTVVECIGDVIKQIQFAPSQGRFETKAFYPFNFHPYGGQVPTSQ
jgi:hypothetical protein